MAGDFNAAREAFLDLVADAIRFEEDPDYAGGLFYNIRLSEFSFEQLVEAFGIPRRFDESSLDAVYRFIQEGTPK